MTCPKAFSAIAEALRSAGATEEIIAAAVNEFGAFEDAPKRQGGRPRKHADRASKDRAYRERKKARDEMRDEIPPRDEIRDKIQAPRDEIRDEIQASQVMASSLRQRGGQSPD
jgi:hypothetical protein